MALPVYFSLLVSSLHQPVTEVSTQCRVLQCVPCRRQAPTVPNSNSSPELRAKSEPISPVSISSARRGCVPAPRAHTRPAARIPRTRTLSCHLCRKWGAINHNILVALSQTSHPTLEDFINDIYSVSKCTQIDTAKTDVSNKLSTAQPYLLSSILGVAACPARTRANQQVHFILRMNQFCERI